MNPKIVLSIFLFVLINLGFAQTNTDEQLANQYYQNKEFDKAVVYYEKVFDKSVSLSSYKNYLQCLFELKEFKKAEKLVKRVSKQNPTVNSFIVDLGQVYKKSDDLPKAKKEFERAIKQLQPDQDAIVSLAEAFVFIKEWEYAISTYLKGRKLLEGTYPFSFELAEVYEQKGDVTAMVNEYLDVLEISDSYIQSVQNALQTSFGNESNSKKTEILKSEVLKRIQSNSDKTIFSEFLIWIQMQQKDYEGAFVQIKALDRRNKEDGSRVMTFAQACAQNQNYDIAIRAYQYVIQKGKDQFNYPFAKMELQNTMYKKITITGNYTMLDLQELEKNYVTTIDEFGKTASTVYLLKNLAHLQAFYLSKTKEAMDLLEEISSIQGVSGNVKADCKLELGDILLMTGDIWEASLKYSQVEKAFKYDAIGQEAKFKNAKISYYTGDFKWAQAQLDVLKGATSKLIANDALELSMVISDNTAIDTNAAPLLLFAKADLLSFQNRNQEAFSTLDSISQLYPNHSLADDVLFKKAALMIKKSDFEAEGKFLAEIISKFPQDLLGDDATFKLAELNELHFNNIDKAKELFQKILTDYPGSLYTVEARKRFRRLRGEVSN